LRTLLGQSLSLNLQSFIKFGHREFHLGDFASIIQPLGSILVGLFFLHRQSESIFPPSLELTKKSNLDSSSQKVDQDCLFSAPEDDQRCSRDRIQSVLKGENCVFDFLMAG
jgi:hypothetical protein